MSIEWINHQGKKILYFNCSNLDLPGFKEDSEKLTATVIKEPENSILMLTDVRNITISPEVVQIFKDCGNVMKKHFHKQAVLGVAGIRYILLNAVSKIIGQEAKVFDDLEKAKIWLASEE